MNINTKIYSGFLGALLLVFSPISHAAFFDLELTVTGGTSQGLNGTPGSFFGSFEIANFTGNDLEIFTGVAEIQNFSLMLDNVWDAGSNTNVSQTFAAPFLNNQFTISFIDGILNDFRFLSAEFQPLDLSIDFPGNSSNGFDWDVITDSDGLIALEGTLGVTLSDMPENMMIPEPELFALLGIGLIGLAVSLRRPSSYRLQA